MGMEIEVYRISDIVNGTANCWNMSIREDIDKLRTISVLNEDGILLEIYNHVGWRGIPCPANLSIPATYQGYPVLAVYGVLAYLNDDGDTQWQEENYDIRSLTIPEGVMIVDRSLWEDCPNLKDIRLPRSLIR